MRSTLSKGNSSSNLSIWLMAGVFLLIAIQYLLTRLLFASVSNENSILGTTQAVVILAMSAGFLAGLLPLVYFKQDEENRLCLDGGAFIVAITGILVVLFASGMQRILESSDRGYKFLQISPSFATLSGALFTLSFENCAEKNRIIWKWKRAFYGIVLLVVSYGLSVSLKSLSIHTILNETILGNELIIIGFIQQGTTDIIILLGSMVFTRHVRVYTLSKTLLSVISISFLAVCVIILASMILQVVIRDPSSNATIVNFLAMLQSKLFQEYTGVGYAIFALTGVFLKITTPNINRGKRKIIKGIA